VKTLLAESGLSKAELAKKLDVDRARVHRYLDKAHRPTKQTINKVNKAVASLVAPFFPMGPAKVPRAAVRVYLGAVAARESGADLEAAAKGLELGFSFMQAYLEPHDVQRAYDSLIGSSASNTLTQRRVLIKLGLELLVELRLILLDLARWQFPMHSRFDQIIAIIERHSPSLKGGLRVTQDAQVIIAYERFYASVANLIGPEIENRRKRAELLEGISSAVRPLIEQLSQIMEKEAGSEHL